LWWRIPHASNRGRTHTLEPFELSVNTLTEALQGNQPNISRHLATLFEGGLLHRRRDGNLIYRLPTPWFSNSVSWFAAAPASGCNFN
jgi:DNA-binding transcriptional ArsR family regulator